MPVPGAPIQVEVDCFCRGANASCIKCHGSGKVVKVGCQRCKATGYEAGVKEAGKCYDCRGNKYRDVDNGMFMPDADTQVF